MRLLKSFVFTLFFAALVLPAITNRVAGQGGASEAPAAFDNQTNGFTDQTTFNADRAAFEKQEIVGTGLGPVYNAQSCAECHQNPVTGGISQIPELRAGHNDINGRFVDAPGGSLIQSRAIHPKIQERVPDTQGLAFVTTGGIHSINEDGGEQALIRAGIEPEWSPDGSKIAFIMPWSLFTMNADGTNLVQVTTEFVYHWSPHWSPDGVKIAFETQGNGPDSVSVINADGTNEVKLANGGAPNWSPHQPASIRTFRSSLNILGDGIAEAGSEPTKNKVRTAPLWGLHTRDRLMHDAGGSSSAPTNNGTQSFTMNEAILRHAGEAANVTNRYRALTPAQKAQLIKFLKSL